MRRLLIALVAGALVAAACSSDGDDTGTDGAGGPGPDAGATESAGADEDGSAATVTAGGEGVADDRLVLNLMWHQHQPRYPLDDAGNVTRPWVRAHATKDYLDMVELVAEYPDIAVTFNLTPSLMLQLEELAQGRNDVYRSLAETPAELLTPDERQFVLDRFFDVNPRVIERFPRYSQLAARTDRSTFSDADITDLQVLFNLAWTDPSYLATEPLASLVQQGRGYDRSDVTTVLGEHDFRTALVLPTHRRLWADGRIEITTTPLAHPILPLVADTDLALAGDPGARLPRERYREFDDARTHVQRGLDEAERLLGDRPTGMWPGEGAVAEPVMRLFADAEVEWIATGEDVLARTLDRGSFERDADGTVLDAEVLYRPWRASTPDGDVVMFFRDNVLSDLIGFEYSGTPATEAVDDFLGRLAAIRDRLAEADAPGPHVVSVILDGENAWEFYPNDGRDFLSELYGRLSTTDWLTVETPSTLLDRAPADGVTALDAPVFPSAWFSPNLATWIGEEEEAVAWDYLRAARLDLRSAEQAGTVTPDQLAVATDQLLWAEGSDWFWWFGDDQDSGDDAYFDAAFRRLLAQMYDALGQPRPAYVDVPIVGVPPLAATSGAGEAVSARVDGDAGSREWAGAQTLRTDEVVLDVAIDDEQLALRLDGPLALGAVDLYLGMPRGTSARGTTIDGRLLGFRASHLLRLTPGTAEPACLHTSLPNVARSDLVSRCRPVEYAVDQRGLVEVGVPLSLLGSLQPGDRILARMATPFSLVPEVPGQFSVPDIGGFDQIVEIADPTGDDHGPGSYLYPTDVVFTSGSYDLTGFEIGRTDDETVFVFEVGAAIDNPWGSPIGLSVQTFDVYIDADPSGSTGRRELVDGRNAALGVADGWDAAVVIEGWESKVLRADADGEVTEDRPTISVTVLGDQGRVIARVPTVALGLDADPAEWGVVVAVLSQEGFPSPGVDRVRDVQPSTEQWRIGGGTGARTETRILDLLSAEPGLQEQLLSAFDPDARPTAEDPTQGLARVSLIRLG